MALRITIPNAREISDGIWLAEVDPEDIQALGVPLLSYSGVSVVLLLRCAEFHQRSGLAFQLPVKVLSRGSTPRTVFVDPQVVDVSTRPSNERSIHPSAPEPLLDGIAKEPAKPSPGDNKFIAELPSSLRDIGMELLRQVRSFHKGQLIYHTKSKKFVETPNFWTAVIQPRDRSLRITVYGTSDNFSAQHLDLKRDLASYTAFKINSIDQISEATRIIRESKKLKELRQIP